uniref:E3 ubiquitin-protein ligase hrd-1 n=1 Tax=Romanomermis culicivorax TaxID=13658 RepID=A0A915HY16_ROMCU
MLRVVLYFTFVCVMMRLHTFPLFTVRPLYLTLKAAKKAFRDIAQSRRAVRYLQTLYPDAAADELTPDAVCIICREEMRTQAKKLPCGHIFHTNCLRSWFQRQQTCPTCRLDILSVSWAGKWDFFVKFA